ncbi:hypothetical protein N7474_010677 [Penicillium riverlandense]|uniref:uncharacterized protein n=1 Tax=Penicillium riverlandense TaxID=1903569 RepID=UPI002548503D|nr:uncharacterized protein N7474_010677 [Penicillium riverlandense]KAJ5807085.1 hypothetical protein N7474_010677 [Penicillium riverlandense]
MARKEAILAAGTLRTFQVLMLSGIGPATTLSEHGISTIIDVPHVGKSLTDHFALFQLYRLRNPERDLVLGSPLLSEPAFMKGMPTDWVINQDVLVHILEPTPGRPLVETMMVYAPAGVPSVPIDGSHIVTSVMLLASSSRGSVSIRSSSPMNPPLVNLITLTPKRIVSPSYRARRMMQALLNMPALSNYMEAEVPPLGMHKLTPESPDSLFEARIRATGLAHAHPAGTATMGKVVDPDLRVYGVDNLRVVDASVCFQ